VGVFVFWLTFFAFLAFFLFSYTLPSPAGGGEGGREGEMWRRSTVVYHKKGHSGRRGGKGREGKGSGRSTGDFSTWRTWMVKCSRMSGEGEKEKEREKKGKMAEEFVMIYLPDDKGVDLLVVVNIDIFLFYILFLFFSFFLSGHDMM